MAILAFILVIISWPIVTLLSNFILGVVLMPFFNAWFKPSSDGKPRYLMADAFQSVVLVGSQTIAALVGKGIFSLLNRKGTPYLAIPFGVWCLAFIIGGRLHGKMGRHIYWSWVVGLVAGWIIATVWIL